MWASCKCCHETDWGSVVWGLMQPISPVQSCRLQEGAERPQCPCGLGCWSYAVGGMQMRTNEWKNTCGTSWAGQHHSRLPMNTVWKDSLNNVPCEAEVYSDCIGELLIPGTQEFSLPFFPLCQCNTKEGYSWERAIGHMVWLCFLTTLCCESKFLRICIRLWKAFSQSTEFCSRQIKVWRNESISTIWNCDLAYSENSWDSRGNFTQILSW